MDLRAIGRSQHVPFHHCMTGHRCAYAADIFSMLRDSTAIVASQ